MGYVILLPAALALLIVGLVKENEKIYMVSSPFWFLLGFYCFTQLAGANPVTVWYGWLGILGIIGGLYIMWDVFFFTPKRNRNNEILENEDNEGFSNIDYSSGNSKRRKMIVKKNRNKEAHDKRVAENIANMLKRE